MTSALDRLPREVRATIHKKLVHIPGGLPVIASTKYVPGIHQYQYGGIFVLNALKKPFSNETNGSLAAWLALMQVNKKTAKEIKEDFFLVNMLSISIPQRSLLGNGPPASLIIPTDMLCQFATITISAARMTGPWEATGGGPDIVVRIKTARAERNLRILKDGKALSEDAIARSVAREVWDQDGDYLDTPLLLHFVKMVREGSEVL